MQLANLHCIVSFAQQVRVHGVTAKWLAYVMGAVYGTATPSCLSKIPLEGMLLLWQHISCQQRQQVDRVL